MKMFPMFLTSFSLAILVLINTHKLIGAKAAEIKGRVSISEIHTTQLAQHHRGIQKRNANYDYDAEDDFYSDYEEEEDYYEDDEDYDLEEAIQNQGFRPPGLPLAEISENRTLHLRIPSRDAPEYMVELYEKFSKNKWVHPKSNIVRSFQNINDDASSPVVGSGQLKGMKTRIHTLVFNVTSISPDEHIDLAKIRLYKLVSKDRQKYVGVDRKVSVYEVFNADQSRHRLISAKHILGPSSGWESFDVTLAVRRWVRFVNSVQILEVRIETVFNNLESGDLDIDTRHENKRDPLLVVFSSDVRKSRLHAKELKELIEHEGDLQASQKESSETIDLTKGFSRFQIWNDSGDENSKSLELNKHALNGNHILHRVKRAKRNRKSRRNNSCRRKPMFVKFADIGWDDWIIAPLGYQAFECTGKCNFPLSDHLTPTKHAIIQTLMFNTNSKKASRPCCVPTKLDPMSILYIDQQGNAVFKYSYDGMIVAECGCR